MYTIHCQFGGDPLGRAKKMLENTGGAGFLALFSRIVEMYF